MKQLYFTTFFTLIFITLYAQNCMMPYGIVLNTQAQIDSFAINYPDCTEIPSGIDIVGLPPDYDQITNLEGLSHITKIEGDLTIIRNYALESCSGLEGLSTVLGGIRIEGNGCYDFNGLNNLTHIGNYLEIRHNFQLASLSGLENLNTIGGAFILRQSLVEQINLNIDSIGGSFSFTACNNLTAINLNELKYIGGSFHVTSNVNLPNLSGMESLNYIGGGMICQLNTNLLSFEGINNLSVVGGDISISHNPLLMNFEALSNAYIQGTLIIAENASLENLNGLNNIETLNNLYISKNSSLQTLAHLENLNYITEDLTILRNNVLINLQGLNGLDSIGGDLSIDWNTGLQNLDGFDNLKSIRGDVYIAQNYELENITGLGNLNEIGTLDSLHGNLTIRSNYELNNLDGLENITSINRLKIESQSLQDIDALSNLTSLKNIEIQDSNLSNLSGLENITTISRDLLLTLSGNVVGTSLMGLNEVTSIGGRVEIRGIGSLEGLNNLVSVGNDMTIRANDLFSLNGLNNLQTIGGDLNIQYSNSLLTMNGLESLEYIGGNLLFSNESLISLQGLDNLNTIGGGLWVLDNNVLTSLAGLENLTQIRDGLWIRYNSALTTLEALSNVDTIGGTNRITQNNALTSLAGLDYVNFVDVDIMQIKNNINLSLCSTPSLCDYIIQGGETDIANNGQTCSDIEEILNYCTELTRLQTTTFYDINQNKIQDGDEQQVFIDGVSFEPDMIYLYSNPVNQNLHFMPPGAYTITYDHSLNPNWQLTTDSISYFVSLEDGELEEVIFGIYPTEQISKIVTTVTSPPTRCNEFITFDITTKNLGTTVASGTTWFEADEYIEQIEFIDQPDTTITSLSYYGWYFTDMYPGESITKQVSIKIPGPPDFPVGGSIYFGAFTKFIDINGEDTSEGFRYEPEVRCSFDPNDKLVSPTRHNDYTLFDEDIIYTVRFQNTGNDVAYNITIKDTLDINLDHSTFRVLGSSHLDKLSTSMNDVGLISFEFRNIFLPDSTANLEGSQGYVTYRIRANEGLLEYTPIENSAGIYFDQNPPVFTNTTLNVMLSELPTVSTASPDELLDFHILPNPNTGIFQVQGIHEGTYKILNTAGQHIQSGDMKNGVQIDISDMPQGVYFMSVTINQQNIVKRIIKI